MTSSRGLPQAAAAWVEPLHLPEGLARQYGWQTLPDPDGGDGLYFSLLRKATE